MQLWCGQGPSLRTYTRAGCACARLLLPRAPQGDYRASSQFKTHLKKSEGASEFSRTNTISQQRRKLPVFTIRDELMQVRRGLCLPPSPPPPPALLSLPPTLRPVAVLTRTRTARQARRHITSLSSVARRPASTGAGCLACGERGGMT